MIEDTWLPTALSFGVKYDDFWHYTPKILWQIIDGYQKRIQQQLEYDNLVAYLQGQYFRLAIASTVGNMFSGKGGKKNEYPQEPLDLHPQEEHELTEEEKEIQVKAIFANLERMKANFERNKSGSGI